MKFPKIRRLIAPLRALGPGLITGASDDDPSGIATYAIAGASTGYTMLWAALFTTPMMSAINGVCAKVGLITGGGLMRTLAKTMPLPLAYALAFSVVVANTFNLGADIAAMGSTAHMLLPLPAEVWIVFFSALIVLVEVFFTYARFAAILKWLCIVLFAYIVTAFVVHPPWPTIVWNTLIPHVEFKSDWLTTFVATLGTTITPYLFFWQSSMTREDKAERHPRAAAKATNEREVREAHLDVNSGAIYSNVVMFFIIVTTAATLGAHGKTSIATAQDAALALRPLAGNFAYALFALGIVGTGLLAVPVLAGSSGYVIAELFGMRAGINQKPERARGYYGIIVAGVAVGMVMALVHVDPIKALYWSAVINGVAAVPLIYAIIRIARDPKILGEWTASRVATFWLWLAFVVMLVSAVAMMISWFKH